MKILLSALCVIFAIYFVAVVWTTDLNLSPWKGKKLPEKYMFMPVNEEGKFVGCINDYYKFSLIKVPDNIQDISNFEFIGYDKSNYLTTPPEGD